MASGKNCAPILSHPSVTLEKKISFAQGIFHPKMLSKFLTEPSNILRAIRSSPTHCGCYLHQKACSTQKGKQHLYKCFSFFWGWGRGLDRDTTVILHLVKKPSQWIIVSAFLLFPPSIIFPRALRISGSVLVPEQFLMQQDCIPPLQSVSSVVSLSSVSVHYREKKNQAGWPAKVTL